MAQPGPLPTTEDKARDLLADLADIAKHAPHQQTALLWEGKIKYAYPELTYWRNHLHEVAAAAIRRALYAEAAVARHEAALADAEAQVRAVVPLGDLSGVAAWTAADAQYRERIAELEGVLRRIQGTCGIPDAHEACRAVLKLAAEALADARGQS